MKKGQALVFIFFLLSIVGVFAGALAVMWQAEIQTRSAQRNGLTAFYLAQAGIESAKTDSCSGDYAGWHGWYQDSANGRYGYWTCGPTYIGQTTCTIQAIGRVVDASNNVLAEKQITVTRNIGSCSQVTGTWQES